MDWNAIISKKKRNVFSFFTSHLFEAIDKWNIDEYWKKLFWPTDMKNDTIWYCLLLWSEKEFMLLNTSMHYTLAHLFIYATYSCITNHATHKLDHTMCWRLTFISYAQLKIPKIIYETVDDDRKHWGDANQWQWKGKILLKKIKVQTRRKKKKELKEKTERKQ